MKGKVARRVRAKKESVRMPHLSSVSFLNLKAFGDWQTLPIKPLNLIFGKNSSGKSSIFHALLWFRDVLCYGDLNVMMPEKSGDFVDLGGLWQFVHFNKEKQKRIGIRLDIADPDAIVFKDIQQQYLKYEAVGDRIGWPRSLVEEALQTISSVRDVFVPGGGEVHYTLEVQFDLSGLKQEDQFRSIFIRPKVSLYINQIKILDFAPLKIPRSQKPETITLYLDEWDLNNEVRCDSKVFHESIIPFFADFAESASWNKAGSSGSSGKWRPSPRLLYDFLQEYKLTPISFSRSQKGIAVFPKRGDNGYVLGDKHLAEEEDVRRYGDSESPSQETIRGRIFRTVMADLLNRVCPIVEKAANSFFKDLNYLAAYRNYPGRELSQNMMRNVRYEPHGSESYRDALVDSKVVERLNQACKSLNADFEIKLSGDRKEWAGTRLQILKNGHELSFRDIGFGWSQVIPVLVELAQQKYSAIFVEQPELHLHTNNQSQLMDVILENLPQKKDSVSPIFLELHSEQMVLRLLRRIREGGGKKTGGIQPDDCSVIHVSKGVDGSVIQKLELSNAGTMVDPWPGGFFESALKDF